MPSDNDQPLRPREILLLSGSKEVALDPADRDDAGRLLRPVAPRESAAGLSRFIAPAAVAVRLTEMSRARLSIAKRIIRLKLTTEAR